MFIACVAFRGLPIYLGGLIVRTPISVEHGLELCISILKFVTRTEHTLFHGFDFCVFISVLCGERTVRRKTYEELRALNRNGT